MPYAIQTKDKVGAEKLRSDDRAAHLEYLTKNKDLILAGGAITDDDGNGGQGALSSSTRTIVRRQNVS